MGWIRELMRAAPTRISSFGDLASRARESTDWPVQIEIQPRSLASLLSKLDRSQELQWLADRPGVQLSLARALDVPLDEIRRRVGGSAPRTPLLRLDDLPALRAIDAPREAPPPGIPPELLGEAPEGLWWLAPRGAGKRVVGFFFEARGHAHREARSWDELPADLGEDRILVELSVPSAVGAWPTPRPGLLVAAPFLPDPALGFSVVRSKASPELVHPLLEWVLSRLPPDTRLERLAAHEWLVQKMGEGKVESWGSVLGLLGLMDEQGMNELTRQPMERVARRFVERRVARVIDPASAHAAWLRRSIHPALLSMLERALVESDLPLSAPRSFAEWLELVPAELEQKLDPSWVRATLTELDTPVDPEKIERALSRLPPGAFRIVASLEQAGILRRTASDRLELGPVWLLEVLDRQAIKRVVEGSPFEWGEALLRPHAAADVASALLERALAEGGSALEPVLDLEADDQPAYCASVEVGLRVLGVARLLGADFGSELLDGFWDESSRLFLRLGEGPPRARLDLFEVGAPASKERGWGSLVLAPGVFELAALSVAETLEHRLEARDGALNPWAATEPPEGLGAVYDRIAQAARAPAPWRIPAFALIARLRAVVGNVSGVERPHAMERPAQIVDEIEHGVLGFDSVVTLQANDASLDLLLGLSRERGLTESKVLEACWTAWDQAGRPPEVTDLAWTVAAKARLWQAIPEPLLVWLLEAETRLTLPYGAFGAEQWRVTRRVLSGAPGLVLPASLWQRMPKDDLEAVLESAGPPPLKDALPVLWERLPGLLRRSFSRELERPAKADPRLVLDLLRSAPPAQTPAVFDDLLRDERIRRLPEPLLRAVRAVLGQRIDQRSPGWRAAYRALALAEQELRRAG